MSLATALFDRQRLRGAVCRGKVLSRKELVYLTVIGQEPELLLDRRRAQSGWVLRKARLRKAFCI